MFPIMLTEIMIEENSYHDWGMLIFEHLWLNAPVNNRVFKGQGNEDIQRLLIITKCFLWGLLHNL